MVIVVPSRRLLVRLLFTSRAPSPSASPSASSCSCFLTQQGSRPNHGNYIPLAAYHLIIPAAGASKDSNSVYVRLEPIKGGAADGSAPSLGNNTGADSLNVKGRIWDLQVVGKTEEARQQWIDKLIRHGAVKGGQLPAGSGAVGGAASTAAGSVPGEPAAPIAPNGYDYRTRPHVWEVCEAPGALLLSCWPIELVALDMLLPCCPWVLPHSSLRAPS